MTLLDKYVLSQTTRRLVIALGIVLLTLVLERVLRLFEFAAANNAAFGLVLQMAAKLLPHYMGLALPAAFFISVLLLMAQLGDNNELDVMLGSGLSLRRMARPVIIAGVIMSMLSIGLLGYMQPLTRYGYRAIRYAATNALWTDAISQQRFYTPSDGVTIFANDIDLQGSGLLGLFVHQVEKSGTVTTLSAARGHVETDPKTNQAIIMLEDVTRMVEEPDKPRSVYHLRNLAYTPDFPLQPAPFRARGDDERELTLSELWRLYQRPDKAPATLAHIAPANVSAELNARLVRSISVALMPFLAVPMGMAAKRRRRGTAVATAAILLLLYHYSLQLGEGLVDLGVVSALIGLWLPLIVFSLFCFNLFRRLDQRLRPDPFERLFDRVDAIWQMLKPGFLKRRQPPE